MKISKLSYLNYCREKDQTCKFQPNHNETICVLFVIRYIEDYVIWGNDNDKQLYFICLLCQGNLRVSLPVDKVVKSL